MCLSPGGWARLAVSGEAPEGVPLSSCVKVGTEGAGRAACEVFIFASAAEAGADLAGTGPRGRSALAEYSEDAVYLCAGAQALGLFSPWGWALLLVAPGYAVHQGGKKLLRYVFTPTAEEREAQRGETPEERKRREKAERRQGRRR